jgi:hypothetical protein
MQKTRQVQRGPTRRRICDQHWGLCLRRQSQFPGQSDHGRPQHLYQRGVQRKLPDEVLEKAKHLILDTLTAMISGSQLPLGRLAIKFARTYGGPRIATVVGSNVVCGPIEAALANECWPIPMRPTTRFLRCNPTQVARLYPPP